MGIQIFSNWISYFEEFFFTQYMKFFDVNMNKDL